MYRLRERILVVRQDEDPEARFGTEDVVDDRSLEQGLEIESLGRLLDALGPWSEHAPRRDAEAGRVRHDPHLGGDLGAVGEGRDHLGPLADGVGEALLRGGRALVIEQALDVAGEDRPEPEQSRLVEEIHDHGRLIAGHVGDHHPGRIGPRLEQRPEAGVELGVDEDQVLAGVDRAGRDARSEFDLARRLDDGLDPGRLGQHRRVIRDHWAMVAHRDVELGHRADPARRVHAGIAVGALSLRNGPVRDRDELDAGRPADDPVRESAPGVAGADQADADRVAGGCPGFEGAKEGRHARFSQ